MADEVVLLGLRFGLVKDCFMNNHNACIFHQILEECADAPRLTFELNQIEDLSRFRQGKARQGKPSQFVLTLANELLRVTKMTKLAVQVCLILFFSSLSNSAFAQGTFRIYNMLRDGEFHISVTNEKTNKTVESPSAVESGRYWKTELKEGRYRFTIRRNDRSIDLGSYDVGDMEEGDVFIRWDNETWRQEHRKSATSVAIPIWIYTITPLKDGA